MLLKPVRAGFLIGLVVAAAGSTARADDCAPAPCAPAMRTITVTQCVPEYYKTTRTAYRTECRQETYTAYRCECVPEVRTRVCTVYRRVAETKSVVRNVCTMVPTVEERTVCRPRYSYVTETKMVSRCVDRGHYECQCVPKRICCLHKLCHRNDCCPPPPPMRTKKVWCPCMVTEQVPCTVCRKVCTMEQCKVQVTVCRPVMRQETVQVCCYRCVPEQQTQTYTVMVQRSVPCQATRTVRVCVPYQQEVTCCRMVPRTVTCQVPCEVAQCCSAPCCDSAPRCCRKHHFGGRGHGHRHGHGGGCGGCCN